MIQNNKPDTKPLIEIGIKVKYSFRDGDPVYCVLKEFYKYNMVEVV